MTESSIGGIKVGTIIGVSGVLILLSLVVKLSDCEAGIKVGPTLGVGTGVDGEGRT